MAELDKDPIPIDAGEDYTIVIYDCNRRRIGDFKMPRGWQLGQPKKWSLILAWLMSTIINHNNHRSGLVLARNDFEVTGG